MAPRTKAELRTQILRARRAIAPEQRRTEADALRAHLTDLLRHEQTICGYVPVGSEPGSIGLIDDAVTARARVLLPVAGHDASGTPSPLRWGEYRPGELVAARYGLLEPPPPWLPPEAMTAAALVLVPALAVDRTGVRLGRGAGFYDRTLAMADPAALLIAVVRDDELVDHLPAESHDVRMTHALTPGQGLVRLG